MSNLVHGSIYFLGKYRPLTVEDTAMVKVKLRLKAATENCDPQLRDWLRSHLDGLFLAINKKNCSSVQADHCDRGVSFAKRPHDPFLKLVLANLPDCPGLNYNA